jgi:glutathione synthase/RimK-type ligase-like ATP-grasp enzyme
MKKKIKEFLLRIPVVKKNHMERFIERQLKSGVLRRLDDPYLEEAEIVQLSRLLSRNLKIGLVKDQDTYKEYIVHRASYPQYRRFLKNNNIEYSFYEIHNNDWMEKAENYDVIIWHPDSKPFSQEEARQKIFLLEKMGKKCFPSFNEIWFYENKINAHYFYRSNNLPEIPTFVSHNKNDALHFLSTCKYPIVSKLSTAAASRGVELFKTKEEAKQAIEKIFSPQGKETSYPFLRQNSYVIFQEFIEDASFDLRVIVIGNKLMGYYRFPKAGDFRASGSNIYEKKEIPKEALDLAWKTKQLYSAHSLAVDLLYSPSRKQYLIIESSIFCAIDTCMQLCINGVPGYYEKNETTYTFKEGKYWVQELTLQDFFKDL